MMQNVLFNFKNIQIQLIESLGVWAARGWDVRNSNEFWIKYRSLLQVEMKDEGQGDEQEFRQQEISDQEENQDLDESIMEPEIKIEHDFEVEHQL